MQEFGDITSAEVSLSHHIIRKQGEVLTIGTQQGDKQVILVDDRLRQELCRRKAEEMKERIFKESSEARTWDNYASTIENVFGLESGAVLEEMLLSIGESGHKLEIWDLGSSRVAMVELHEELARRNKAHLVNLYAVSLKEQQNPQHPNIHFLHKNLEADFLKEGEVVDKAFCISVAPYLADPIGFAHRVFQHLRDKSYAYVYFSPFISSERLITTSLPAKDWFKINMGARVKETESSGGENYHLQLRKFERVQPRFSDPLPLIPVLDIRLWLGGFKRNGDLSHLESREGIYKELGDISINPKLSYILLAR